MIRRTSDPKSVGPEDKESVILREGSLRVSGKTHRTIQKSLQNNDRET